MASLGDSGPVFCHTTNYLSISVIQLIGLAQRLEELEGVRQQQEGTIIAKQEENTVASSQIKVRTADITD